MKRLGTWLFGAQSCLLGLLAVSEITQADCGLGQCGNFVRQYERCMPGECYLFEELVSCTIDDYSCRDGTRRIWSYRPLYYARDNSELLTNLDKKLCPNKKNCFWPYTKHQQY